MEKQNSGEFQIPVTVEFEDVDSYNIAHHTKMVAYLERARVRFFMSQGYKFGESTIHPVLYNVNMVFKKTVQIMDELMIAVFIDSLEPYRLVLGYKILRRGELVAKATTTIAFIEGQTKKLVPVPGEFQGKNGK